MAVSVQASGTGNGGSALTVTTEHQLADVNVAGVFTFHVDTSTLQAGDVLEARCYQMPLTGGTPVVAAFAAWYGAQPTHDVMKVMSPIGNDLTDSTALRFSLKQTFGTGRSVKWKVLKYS